MWENTSPRQINMLPIIDLNYSDGTCVYSTLASDHTHTHRFNGPFSRTTRVSRYQKGKSNLDFTEARDSEWQWHQLGHLQVCISLQTDNHARTPPLSFFTGRMPFLSPNQQHQSTEGQSEVLHIVEIFICFLSACSIGDCCTIWIHIAQIASEARRFSYH